MSVSYLRLRPIHCQLLLDVCQTNAHSSEMHVCTLFRTPKFHIKLCAGNQNHKYCLKNLVGGKDTKCLGAMSTVGTASILLLPRVKSILQ